MGGKREGVGGVALGLIVRLLLVVILRLDLLHAEDDVGLLGK